MQLGVIEVPSLKDLFVEKIEEQILSGKLKVGDALPSERQIQADTHISKTVIHAGLAELEAKGFVQVIPRKGTVVANYLETGTVESLNTVIRRNGGIMTPHQTRSFLEARVALEGTALRVLADKADEEDLQFLEALLQNIRDEAAVPDNIDKVAEALFTFHRGICLRSGNEFIPLLLNEFKSTIISFWVRSLQLYGADANIRLAEKYLEDLRTHDGEKAVSRLKKSIHEYLVAVCGNGDTQKNLINMEEFK